MMCASVSFSQNKKNHSTPPSPQNLPPENHFTWINTCYGDTTCFINQSLRSNSYTWTVLGDTVNIFGIHHTQVLYNNTTDSIICYHFTTPGTYTVCFNAFDNHIDSIYPTITIDTITKADFEFIHCANNFVNHSLCSSSFYWDFGDGANSTSIMPHHQYIDTGTYNVSLIAYNGAKSDTITQSIYIDVTASANTNYTYNVSHDTVWVHAAANSIPSSTFFWSFGDGGYLNGQDTFYVYKDSTAAYGLSLNSTNGCGPEFGATDTVYITQIPPDRPPSGLDFSNSILSIVPNPVSNNNYIDAFFNTYNDNTYLVQVFNDIGQKIYEENFAFQTGINEFKISSENMAAGLYLMVMQAGNSYIRQKFYIIQKP